MRHAASLVAAMEGISRPAFRIAKELANNSRSGLTVRFLAKKLELPEEEVEYLVDINHRFLFTDLTKIKLVPEGFSAVKRISEGLENRGDIDSLYRLVKTLDAHDFRRLEEQIGIERPGAKKHAVEELLARHYHHPDSVVSYVATRGFSETARELFDIVWQSRDGLMPLPKLRAQQTRSDYDLELALWELFRGFALFEMFRFDAEERLVRVTGLLAETRQYREATARRKAGRTKLKPERGKIEECTNFELDFSDRIGRLVAALAAKPARLRGDGELFREDLTRLAEICPDDREPSLGTFLWAAEGAGWIARVDNELRAGALDTLLEMDRLERHRVLYDWMLGAQGKEGMLGNAAEMLAACKPGAWYSALEFAEVACRLGVDSEQPVLKLGGGHYQYASASISGQFERAMVRALEETFLWLGIVARGDTGGTSVFTLTDIGEFLLRLREAGDLTTRYPKRDAQIIVQPNFDIVVPTQDMDPLLTVPLDQFATRSSTGQATVYCVSKESFTHAIQEGLDGEAFVDFLIAHNRNHSLPANVMQTLDDWRGGIKRVRLKTVQVLETDDPLVLADLMHRRRFKKHLLRVDPYKEVRYVKISRAELTKALEKDGFVVE
ncbi:MAG TPA: helicase-associated domain-containing protein [Candidatus Hydrogenedentes bacterium]|nr:helicase-associated domain-containing protein [Candidatus Hydrogenedentota bacterium]HPG69566.1 helicase-associated domain-containing protein [Candidatus Hydrogenedentota bacterium]